MTNRTVSVTLTANVAQYMAALRAAGASTAALGASGTKLAAQTGLVTAKMAGLATGVGFVTATAVKQMADFERVMSLVQATTEATTDQMAKLRKAALDVGGESIYTPTEAADAIAILSKAGVDAADIIGGALAGALSLAAAGEMEVGEAAEIAAGALNTFRIAGEDMPHVADLLAAAANEAQGEVHDLGFAMRMSSAVAAQAGMDIEETIAGLGAMANRGLLGSDAGTSLKSFMVHLTATTDTASESMKVLGLSAYDAQGDFIGLEAVAQQLQEGLAKLSQEEQLIALRTVFGTDAIRAAAVFGEEGGAGIAEWIRKTDREGYAEEFMTTLNDNIIGDLKKLRSSMNELFIESADGANGPLRELVQALTDVAGAVTKVDEVTSGKDNEGLGLFTPGWDYPRIIKDRIMAPWRDEEEPEVGPIISPETSQAVRDAEQASLDLVGAVDNLQISSAGATDATYGLAGAAMQGAAAERELAASATGAAGQVASLEEQLWGAMDAAMGYVGAMIAAQSSSRDLLTFGDRLHASALQPAVPGASGSSSSSSSPSSSKSKPKSDAQKEAEKKAREAKTKETNDRIARWREADAKQKEREIKRARNAADKKAERRADREARKDVKGGVKDFIDTDKKAKAGEYIGEFNNTNEVGEKTGSLTDKETERLDKKIDGIRARHKKALDAQIKALRDSQKAAAEAASSIAETASSTKSAGGAASGAATATREYNTSLDENTVAGRKNLDTIDSMVQEVWDHAEAMGKAAELAGGDAEEVGQAMRDALTEGYDALTKAAEAEGYATREVEKYLKTLGTIPEIIETLFVVKVDDKELKDLNDSWADLQLKYDAARRKTTKMNEDQDRYDESRRRASEEAGDVEPKKSEPKKSKPNPSRLDPRFSRQLPGFAMGGEYRGSGSTTSDGINARLSNREYVIRASQYAANKDLVHAINNGSGKVGGGSVGVLIEGGVNVVAPSPITAGKNVIDELDQQAYRKGIR